MTELENDVWRLINENANLTDVVLVFGDEKKRAEFAVHAAILSARSEVFAAMFEHDMQEKNRRQVEITDVDAKMGEALVNYLYGGKPNVDKNAERLLPIADKYQLHSLKSICEGVLCFRLNSASVCNLLLLADMHNSAVLKSKFIEYIHCHSSCVVECESIHDLSDIIMKKRLELYCELFKHIPPDTCHTWTPPSLTCDPYEFSWSYSCSSVSKCSKVLTIGKFKEKHLFEEYFDENILHDFVETSPFPALKSLNNNLSVQFSVKLYPHGENNDCKEHLSLYLKLKCDEMMKVAVKVKASIMVKENSDKGYTLEIGKKLSNGESIGWPKFISREQLNENKVLFLNGKDQLDLLCEVFYIENIVTPVTKSGVNTFADEYRFSIARDISQLYTNQKLTDIVFEIGDKKLYAHKSIVSARSAMFARMFKRKSRVQIKGVDVETFSNMLALVYGQREALTHMEPAMLPLLDKFELSSLRQVCQIALCDQLDDTNVAQYLLLADKHKATMLKVKAFEYICSKHSVLTQNDSLKVIQQQNPKLFHELLCYKLDNWRNVVENPLKQLSQAGLNPNANSFTPSTMAMPGAGSSWQIQPYYITAQAPSPWTVSGQSDTWEVTQQVFVQPRHPIYIAYNLA